MPVLLPIASPIVLPIVLPIGTCYPVAFNRSRDPGPDRAKGPGPGLLGPGAGAGTPWARGLGAPGPRCRIRVSTVTTYCQASYLLSGKLATVRQAFSRMKLAPNFRIHAPKRFRILCTQQPHTFSSSSFFVKQKRKTKTSTKSHI